MCARDACFIVKGSSTFCPKNNNIPFGLIDFSDHSNPLPAALCSAKDINVNTIPAESGQFQGGDFCFLQNKTGDLKALSNVRMNNDSHLFFIVEAVKI
jgi:hypothetical protein